MNVATLAFNNIRRTPVRAVLTAVSVLIAAGTLNVVLSLDRGYSSAVQRELVEKTGVHLYITKEGCPIEAASVIAQGGWSSAAALRKFYVQPSVACPDDVPRVLETQKQPAPPVATTTTCATRRSPSQPRSFSRPRRRGRTLTTSETSAGQQPDESASTTASPTRSRPHMKSAPPAARDPDYSPASS